MRSTSKAYFTNKITIKVCTLLLLCIYIIGSIGQPLQAASGPSSIKFNGQPIDVNIKNYTNINSAGLYVFTNSITYEIEKPVQEYFNRFTIKYSSKNCIKGKIYYQVYGSSYSEEFFLEAGNNIAFSSLIDGYLSYKKGSNISKIVFSDLENNENAFVLHEISTLVYTVQYANTVYIENSRFKLGVHLIWGGGLSYYEDKNDGDKSITNMLNYHDTGRLVQQSYYGSSEFPYQCATYNGSKWSYNPVQGGDQYGNKSKLVDFYIDDTSIYVKCRPLDWAQNNQYTFSYMENSYMLHSDYIEIDNRFIDFSGYNHGAKKDQELPAFYTISYLDRFTFYNGTKPWTDAKLTTKSNLPFWGGNSNSYFAMENGNTETWCSWTSSKTGYGIGIYTPEITTLLAGRYSYNGSKDPLNGATNYVAPLIKMSMQNFKAFEYSYIITSGTISEIRETFKQNKDKIDQNWDDFSSNTNTKIDYTRLNFDKAYEINAFAKFKQCYAVNTSTGSVKFTVSGTDDECDAYTYINYQNNSVSLSTKDYRYLVYSYMIPTSNKDFDGSQHVTELFICTGSRTVAEAGASILINLIKDGKYHYEIIDLYEKCPQLWSKSGETINRIRLDFLSKSTTGDNFYLSEFSLAKDITTAEIYAGNSISAATPTPTDSSSNGPTSIITAPPTMPPDENGQDTPSTPVCNSPSNGNIGSNNGNNNPQHGNDNNQQNPGNPGDNNSNNDYYYEEEYATGNDTDEVNTTLIIVLIIVCCVFIAGGSGILICILIRSRKKSSESITCTEDTAQ